MPSLQLALITTFTGTGDVVMRCEGGGVGKLPAVDIHSPRTAFHTTVRTAREKRGFKAGLCQREKFFPEHGQSTDKKLPGTPRSGRIQPDRPRILLLMNPRSADA